MGRFRRWILNRLLRKELSVIETEIEEEFRFHLDMRAAYFESQGMDPEQARAEAQKLFGDPDRLRRAGVQGLTAARRKEKRAWFLAWMGQDLGDGVRRFIRHPGFSFLAVGTLALGLATSTAVFTYVNAYQQPIPGAEGKGLYQLFTGSEDAQFNPLSYPDYLDLLEAGEGIFQVAGFGRPLFAATVRTGTFTGVVFGNGVTGEFFPLLNVEMSLGRGLSPLDDDAGAEPVVVISHNYWGQHYRYDPDVLGRTLLLNNRPHTIVGVVGPDFLGSLSVSRPDIWLPFSQFKPVYWARTDNAANREVGTVTPYVRLAEGVGERQAREVLEVLTGRLDLEEPLAGRTRRFQLEPAKWIHPEVRRAEMPTTRIMLIAAAALLILACANVANLVLSAGMRRDQEIALRAAIGASRWRLIRQLLAENLLVSFVAGGLGLVLAGPAAHRLSSYFARPSVWGNSVAREISLDLRVLAFGFILALGVGVLTGIIPALKSSGRKPAAALKAGGRWSSDRAGAGGRRVPGTGDLFIAAQVALSVVLLFVAALVLRTLDSARRIDPGFNTEWTLASYVSTSSMGVPSEERHAFYQGLIRHFEDLAWVRAATVSEQAPLSGHPVRDVLIPGSEDPVRTTVARVFPGYFETMEVEILRGRPLLATDTSTSAGVVVVNETLARRSDPTGYAIGLRLTLPAGPGNEERSYEVVGVARNARVTSVLPDPGPVAYFSLPQHMSAPGNALLLKVAGDPAATVPQMEDELRAVDPRLAIVNILPYSRVVDGFLYPQRMNAELFSVIAVLGLLLSGSGVFGVTSLAVARMRKEIGIRFAIVAQGRSIARLVVSRISVAVVLGLVTGLGGAFLTARWVEGLLWGVHPLDPISLGGGVVGLLGAVVLAVSFPVRRALSVDPVGYLQAE